MAGFTSGDIVRVTAKNTFLSQDLQQTFHLRANGTGDIDEASAQSLIKARFDAGYAEIADIQSTGFNYGSIWMWNVTQDAPIGEVPWPTLTTGADVGAKLPSQLAILTYHHTSVARSQGKKYWGGFCVGSLDTTSFVDSDALDDINALITTLFGTWLVGTGTLEFGNWSYVHSRFALWLSHTVANEFHTQRRRTVGVGS